MCWWFSLLARIPTYVLPGHPGTGRSGTQSDITFPHPELRYALSYNPSSSLSSPPTASLLLQKILNRLAEEISNLFLQWCLHLWCLPTDSSHCQSQEFRSTLYPQFSTYPLSFLAMNKVFASTSSADAILIISVSLITLRPLNIALNCCLVYPAFSATALCFKHFLIIIASTFGATIEFKFSSPFLKFL